MLPEASVIATPPTPAVHGIPFSTPLIPPIECGERDASRSARREARNPLLTLPTVVQLRALPPDIRDMVAGLCREISAEAATRAEHSWRKHKAPMAAYWKAVSVYAKHTAMAITAGRRAA